MSEKNRSSGESQESRVARLGWTLSGAPGELKYIDKVLLQIPIEYQRTRSEPRAIAIAKAWDWPSFGAVIVGKREGQYFVVDGQHRVAAAMKRPEISQLPCIIFYASNVQQEAQAFIGANSGRKPVSTVDMFRAQLAANDPIALYVKSVLDGLGIKPSKGAYPRTLKSMLWAMTTATEDKALFARVINLASEMCGTESAVQEILLHGLTYIDKHVENGLDNKLLRTRLLKIGSENAVSGGRRMAMAMAKGGAKVWAQGILEAANKNCKYRIEI